MALHRAAIGGGTITRCLAALLEVDRVLLSRAFTVRLDAGEALLIDQRRMLHGRLPLGQGQESLHVTRRRALVQAYGRRLETDE